MITEHPRMEPAGRVVAGRYRLRRLLGRSGMGAVWLAVDQTLHRRVAVKQLLLSGVATDQERLAARARLLREARLTRRAGPLGVVIEGLLAKDPARRLNPDQARGALRAIQRGQPPPPIRSAR